MITQISPTEDDVEETMCTLQFATRVRGVELGAAKSHKKSSTGEMLEMKKTITRMRADISSYKKNLLEKEKEIAKINHSSTNNSNELTEKENTLKKKLIYIGELEKKVNDYDQKENNVKRSIMMIEKERDHIANELNVSNEQLSQLKIKNQNIIKENISMTNELDDMKSKIKIQERLSVKATRHEDVSKLEEKVNELKTMIDNKEKMIDTLTNEMNHMEKQMKHNKQLVRKQIKEYCTENDQLKHEVAQLKKNHEKNLALNAEKDNATSNTTSPPPLPSFARGKVHGSSVCNNASPENLSIIMDQEEELSEDQISIMADEDMELDESSNISIDKRSSSSSSRRSLRISTGSSCMELDFSSDNNNINNENVKPSLRATTAPSAPSAPSTPSVSITPPSVLSSNKKQRFSSTKKSISSLRNQSTPRSTRSNATRYSATRSTRFTKTTPIKHTPSKDKNKQAEKGILKKSAQISRAERLQKWKDEKARSKGIHGSKRTSMLASASSPVLKSLDNNKKVRFEGSIMEKDTTPSKSPIKGRSNLGKESSRSRYRSQPSTPHHFIKSSSYSSLSTPASRNSSISSSSTTTLKKGGLLAKMKSLGGLKKGASRNGGAMRTSRAAKGSSRSRNIRSSTGASRPSSGRWN